MLIDYDPAKREATLRDRGLDFDDAPEIFAGPYFQIEDDRADYGEVRWIRFGLLRRTMVVLVWTQRGEARRVISMRKCNAKEQKRYRDRLARSG